MGDVEFCPLDRAYPHMIRKQEKTDLFGEVRYAPTYNAQDHISYLNSTVQDLQHQNDKIYHEMTFNRDKLEKEIIQINNLLQNLVETDKNSKSVQDKAYLPESHQNVIYQGILNRKNVNKRDPYQEVNNLSVPHLPKETNTNSFWSDPANIQLVRILIITIIVFLIAIAIVAICAIAVGLSRRPGK